VVVVKAVRAPVAPGLVRRVLAAAAAEPEVAGALAPAGDSPELTVRITGDRELRRLNCQFLDDDQVTDVLAFPSGDATGAYLGDLALSWPAVARQAEAVGHKPEVEAALLAVHGFLHLLGWDHGTPAAEREMTRVALACLARSGVHPAAGRL